MRPVMTSAFELSRMRSLYSLTVDSSQVFRVRCPESSLSMAARALADFASSDFSGTFRVTSTDHLGVFLPTSFCAVSSWSAWPPAMGKMDCQIRRASSWEHGTRRSTRLEQLAEPRAVREHAQGVVRAALDGVVALALHGRHAEASHRDVTKIRSS
eukprot:4978168-Pyramimonas_sp.AAC.1